MPQITKAQVKEFVEAAHGNLPHVKEMLAQTPDLRAEELRSPSPLG